MGDIVLGTQGWKHRTWVGSFYPHGTATREMLTRYGRAFGTVEVTETAIAVPAGPVLRDWGMAVPAHFRFAFTLPLVITHEYRLRGSANLLGEFVDRVSQLGERLGPIRIALSPAFRPHAGTRRALADFLEALPSGYHWAVEFRHRGWLSDDTHALLSAHNVAIVLADGRWLPRARLLDLVSRPTADIAYLRWSGGRRRLTDVSRSEVDRSRELRAWRRALAALAGRVGTVFGYAGDAFEGHAPHTVRALASDERAEPDAVELPWRQAQPV